MKPVYPLLFFFLLCTTYSVLATATDSLPSAVKIDFTQVNKLQVIKYQPRQARSGKDGGYRFTLLNLLRIANGGKTGKNGRPGYKLL